MEGLCFAWKGTIYELPGDRPWSLVDALWRAGRRGLSIDTLNDVVWERVGSPDLGKIKQNVSRAAERARENMTRSATPWPDGDSAQPDPLESVPPPHVVRRRLYELVQATTFIRRLLRLSEKLHASPQPAPASDGEEVVLRLVGGETDTEAAWQEGGRP